jgi:hypothetical protein
MLMYYTVTCMKNLRKTTFSFSQVPLLLKFLISPDGKSFFVQIFNHCFQNVHTLLLLFSGSLVYLEGRRGPRSQKYILRIHENKRIFA